MARVHCQHQHRAKLLPWPSDSRQLVSYYQKPANTIWDFNDIELPGEEAWNGPLARSLAWGQTSSQAVLQQVCRLPGGQYFQQPPSLTASVTVRTYAGGCSDCRLLSVRHGARMPSQWPADQTDNEGNFSTEHFLLCSQCMIEEVQCRRGMLLLVPSPAPWRSPSSILSTPSKHACRWVCICADHSGGMPLMHAVCQLYTHIGH